MRSRIYVRLVYTAVVSGLRGGYCSTFVHREWDCGGPFFQIVLHMFSHELRTHARSRIYLGSTCTCHMLGYVPRDLSPGGDGGIEITVYDTKEMPLLDPHNYFHYKWMQYLIWRKWMMGKEFVDNFERMTRKCGLGARIKFFWKNISQCCWGGGALL